MKRVVPLIFRSLIGLLIGLLLGLGVAMISGENPFTVLQVIVNSAFGTRYDLGVTLYYATPLVFTGLSVAVAFHAGLFNIGAEGQLTLAALAAAATAMLFPDLPPIIAPIFAMSCAFAVAGIWGWIPGWLRVRRGGHEVINTIMLNFVSAALVSWAVTGFLQNPEVQNPETRVVPPAYFLRSWSKFVFSIWFGAKCICGRNHYRHRHFYGKNIYFLSGYCPD